MLCPYQRQERHFLDEGRREEFAQPFTRWLLIAVGAFLKGGLRIGCRGRCRCGGNLRGVAACRGRGWRSGVVWVVRRTHIPRRLGLRARGIILGMLREIVFVDGALAL